MSMFQQRHYEAIARLLGAHHPDYACHQCGGAIEIIDSLAIMFKADNPRFKEDRFRRAIEKAHQDFTQAAEVRQDALRSSRVVRPI